MSGHWVTMVRKESKKVFKGGQSHGDPIEYKLLVPEGQRVEEDMVDTLEDEKEDEYLFRFVDDADERS